MPRYDVITVGDLNPDIVLSGIESIAPRLGTEQFFGSMERTLGGSGALTTVTMSRLGLRTALVARVGVDEPAEFCRTILKREGVEPMLLVNPALTTGVTVAVTYPSDRLLLTSPGAIGDLTAEEVTDELLAEARHLHVSSYFMQRRLQPGLARLFRRARALGLTTSLDTGWDPSGAWLDAHLTATLADTDIFLPNAVELRHLAGLDDLDAAAARLLELGAGSIVVKDGSHGARLYTRAGRVLEPGFRVSPIDTTGAGDAFNAGYIAAMLEGRPIAHRLRFANACGALVTQVRGGAGGNLRRADFDSMYERDR